MTFKTPPAEYAKAAESQKTWAREIADKLERCEPIGDFDGAFAAAIMRSWADSLATLEPVDGRRARGKLDYASVAMAYEAMRRRGVSGFAAKGRLAERFNVTDEAIRLAIQKQGPAAKQWFDAWSRGKTSAKLSKK